MDPTVGLGLFVSAGVLGITHAIEPDHVAVIAALTHEAADPKLSAIVGGCFAIGHAILVVIWVGTALLLFGATRFPPVLEQFGLLVVGTILAMLSLYLGVTGTRRLLHRHEHEHGAGPHSHVHVHLPIGSPGGTGSGEQGDAMDAHGDHAHDHGVLEYLKIGTIGALFTLSPPVSMIAFISVVMSNRGGTLVVGVVAAYTISIVASMAAIGSGVGSLSKRTRRKGERYHAMFQIVASVLVFAVAVLLLVDAVPPLLS
ncbi:MAG: hypothetical protein ABEJ84_04645 [Halodesulfurarchaeum sp.]